MSKLRNIIVTGCNKGIGEGIVSHLAKNNIWNIIMAVRNIQLGKKTKQHILTSHPNAKINVEQLDISNFNSIQQFIETIELKYQQIDVLINNAGIKIDKFDIQTFNKTFETNFYGPIKLSQQLLPYISKNGKIITIGSMMGKLVFNQLQNQHIKKLYKNPQLKKQQILNLVNQFKQSIINNTNEGWPRNIYGLSKLNINVYCNILSRYEQVMKRGIQIYSCCPGYVSTDMNNHKGILTIQQGIKTPIFLTQLPFQINHKYQGQFFEKQQLSSTFQDFI